MKKKPHKRRVLHPAFSTYHGRVHIPNITTQPIIFQQRGIYLNSVCAGHVIVDESEIFQPPKNKPF